MCMCYYEGNKNKVAWNSHVNTQFWVWLEQMHLGTIKGHTQTQLPPTRKEMPNGRRLSENSQNTSGIKHESTNIKDK